MRGCGCPCPRGRATRLLWESPEGAVRRRERFACQIARNSLPAIKKPKLAVHAISWHYAGYGASGQRRSELKTWEDGEEVSHSVQTDARTPAKRLPLCCQWNNYSTFGISWAGNHVRRVHRLNWIRMTEAIAFNRVSVLVILVKLLPKMSQEQGRKRCQSKGPRLR